MTNEDRQEWLRVAWGTLGHLPPDLLRLGCRKAREKCDHPSKVVPAILAATSEMLNRRREYLLSEGDLAQLAPPRRHVMERRGEPMDEADTAELNRILAYLGAATRYRPDGSRYKANPNSDDEQPQTMGETR